MFSPKPVLQVFIDYVTLAYHEARNVRHLVQSGHLPRDSYECLIDLPRNRTMAWVAIQPVRREARQANSVTRAELVFARKFGIDLDGLLALYKNPKWRHAQAYGGNQWKTATELILELKRAIEIGDLDTISGTIEKLQHARHNTGSLSEKLAGLDLSLPA